MLYLFIYFGLYVAFHTVQVISRGVVGRAEETSTYSWSRFCTVNYRPTASNYQISHLRPCREPNPGLRSGRRKCYHSATVAPQMKCYKSVVRLCTLFISVIIGRVHQVKTEKLISLPYTPFTLQAVYPMVRSFTRRRNRLQGRLISSEIWCIHEDMTVSNS